ncbi:MAG: tRNA (adenosine(37)-N6)-threonylcarbamoyltransferase complex ATPase subunit type 1 TsaE [Rubripirellula sp.]
MTEPTLEIESLDLDGIQHLADSLARYLPCPLTVGLVGTLGAGKTTLAQAISRAFGIDASDVTSPTFTLLQTYHVGDRTLHHLDAYRVADDDEFLELGVEELYEDPKAWTLIEWADRVRDAVPEETLWVVIEIDSDPNRRKLQFSTSDSGLAATLRTALRETSLND